MQQMTPREILAHLVGFDTVSRNDNLDLVDFAEGYLRACGAQTGRMLSADGRKAALFAHAGPQEPGGVVLSGHSDVVPVDGQTWTSDPFSLTERDGNLYGRGTCDMKGFDALALWAVGQAALRGVTTPLQLALSYDEEVGCEIAAPLIAAMDGAGLPRAASAIIGEPSGMQVVTGHKSGFSWKVDVHGHEVHSSLIHQGVSAILYGARLIEWSNEVNAANRLKPPGPLASGFNPPWTSSNVGMVNGGTAHNITAGACSFLTEVRLVPGEDMATYKASFEARRAALEAEMQAIHPAAGIDAQEVFNVPPLVPEPGGVAETLARALTGDNGAHVVSYGTEAGHFQAAGFSAVVCGPGHIAQAHQADEFISLEQFAKGQDFMERLLDRAR